MKRRLPITTVEVRRWCRACRCETMHTVTDGRVGMCLPCLHALDQRIAADKAEAARQYRLWKENA